MVFKMPKKRLSDIVFQRVSPPDHKFDLTPEDLADVLVRRLGMKRKESRANHARLLLESLKYKKENIPLSIEEISKVLNVSQSQTYEELRKWRTLGLLEFVKIPTQTGYIKGYMLTSNTVNKLLDRVESSTKSFFRKTRRIAKDFDDLLMLEMARKQKQDGGVVPAEEKTEGKEESEEAEKDEEEN